MDAELLPRAAALAARAVEPHADRCDRDATWPVDAMKALQADGLTGLVVPVAHGGLGEGLLALTRVCEVLAIADASTALCFGMHSVGTACIAAKATADQAKRFLEPIAAGEHITTLALSEPGTGSHFYLPEVTMTQAEDDAFRLDGTKCFVTNGAHADSYVVSTVAAEPDAPLGHFSMVMLPHGVEGAGWQAEWQGWGMRANSARSVVLSDARVARNNLLGAEGDQIWYVFNVVAPFFLVAMAGTYLGIATRAVDEARAHLSARTHSHSGKTLAEIDVLQHRLGCVWAQLQRTRRLCYWAAGEADAGGPDALPALCAAKAEVGHAAVDVVNECMTLVGGKAYRDGSILQRLMRDARAAHVMSPTTDILYTWAGRALLNLPLLGQ